MLYLIEEVRPLIYREFEMGEPDCIGERDKGFIRLNGYGMRCQLILPLPRRIDKAAPTGGQ